MSTAPQIARALKAVMQREIAGECVEDAFLRLDRDDLTPAAHGAGEFNRMHADIGTAVERDYALAEILPAQIQKINQ